MEPNGCKYDYEYAVACEPRAMDSYESYNRYMSPCCWLEIYDEPLIGCGPPVDLQPLYGSYCSIDNYVKRSSRV